MVFSYLFKDYNINNRVSAIILFLFLFFISLSEMTLELMAAQCFIFFLAGFDTSSGILGHCLLELSKQPQYQEKLRDEVRRAVREIGNGEITYDILNKIPYMDQVVFGMCDTSDLFYIIPSSF